MVVAVGFGSVGCDRGEETESSRDVAQSSPSPSPESGSKSDRRGETTGDTGAVEDRRALRSGSDAGDRGEGLETEELKDGSSQQRKLLKRARAHFLEGRLEEAEPIFEELVGGGPMSGARASGYIALGEIYLETDRPDQAISLLESMPPPGEEVVEAQLVRARAYRRAGKVRDGIDVYKHVLRLQPNYLFVYRELGRIYAEEGERQKAETVLGMYEKRLRALASELEEPEESPQVKRINILDIFSVLNNQRAKRAVRNALDDPQFRVRRRAAEAAGQMGIKGARDRLETMAEEDPFRAVRREAERALERLDG